MTKSLSAEHETARRQYLSASGKWLIIFVFCVVCVVVAFGWRDAALVAQRLSFWKLALLCALAGLHYLIRASRWHLIVRAHGVQNPWLNNILHYFGGLAMIVTPARLGELVRLRWLRRDTGGPIRGLLPIAIADRAIELASLLVLLLGALAFSSLGSGAVWLLVVTGCAIVIALCHPVLLERLLMALWHALRHRAMRGFAKTRRALRELAKIMTPSVMLPVLCIGTLGWGLEAIAFWMLLIWLETPLPFTAAAAIFLTAILAGALSGLPGGLGGTEATGVGLLILQGIAAEQAVIAILIIRVATLWFAIFIGLAFFPIAEARTSAALHGAQR